MHNEDLLLASHPGEPVADEGRAPPVTILLVEDDENQRLLYTEELREAGYAVAVACDGRQALACCDEAMPDLVIMDINMPGMDGIDAMDRMLGRNHKLPIILYTAYTSYRDSFRAWSADAYVVKSSDLTELKQAIASVLEARRKAEKG